MLLKGIHFVSDSGAKLVVFGGIVLAVFSLTIYIFLGKGAKESLIEQMRERKIIQARFIARSFQAIFENITSSLSILRSSLDDATDLEDKQALMKELIDNWGQTPLMGLALTDVSGRIEILVNRQDITEGVGASLADRPYFQQLVATQKPVVSQVYVSKAGVTKGQYIVSVSVPIFDQNKQFAGGLVGVLSSELLASQNISPFKTSPRSAVHIVDSTNATVIYSDNPEMLGKNVFDSVSSLFDFLGKDILLAAMKKNSVTLKEDSLRVVLPNAQYKLIPYLIAWSPVTIGEVVYYVAITTPEDELLDFVTPFYVKNIILVYVGYLLIAVVAVWLAKTYTRRVTIAEEHLHHNVELEDPSKIEPKR